MIVINIIVITMIIIITMVDIGVVDIVTVAWESSDTKNHLCCSRMKYSTFNYGRIQYWTTASPQWWWWWHWSSSCMTTVIKCWEEDFQGNVTMILFLTGTMIALVVRSEQRIPSWMIGIRYIEGLILSAVDNGGDRWLEQWAQCEYRERASEA